MDLAALADYESLQEAQIIYKPVEITNPKAQRRWGKADRVTTVLTAVEPKGLQDLRPYVAGMGPKTKETYYPYHAVANNPALNTSQAKDKIIEAFDEHRRREVMEEQTFRQERSVEVVGSLLDSINRNTELS